MALDLTQLDSYLTRAQTLTETDFDEVDQLLTSLREEADGGSALAASYLSQFANANESYRQHLLANQSPALLSLYWGYTLRMQEQVEVPASRLPRATSVADAKADTKPSLFVEWDPSPVAVVTFTGNYGLTTRMDVSASTARALTTAVDLVRADAGSRPADDTGPVNKVQVALELLADLNDRVVIIKGQSPVIPAGKIPMSEADYQLARKELVLAAEKLADEGRNSVEYFINQGLTKTRQSNDRLLKAYNWARFDLEKAGTLFSRPPVKSAVAVLGGQAKGQAGNPNQITLVASGNGTDDPLQPILWFWNNVPQLRGEILAIAQYEKDFSTKLRGIKDLNGRNVGQLTIDLKKLLETAERNPEAFQGGQLTRLEYSIVINYIGSWLNFRYAQLQGLDPKTDIADSMGISQGEGAMLPIAGVISFEQGLVMMNLVGISVQRARELTTGALNALQIQNLHISQAQAIAKQVNQELGLTGRKDAVEVAIIIDDFTYSMTSSNFRALALCADKVDAIKQARKDARGMKHDLPEITYLKLSAPAHHTQGQQDAYAYFNQIRAILPPEYNIDPTGKAAFPIYSTEDGSDITQEADPVDRCLHDMMPGTMDFRNPVRAAYDNKGQAMNAVNIGPDRGSSVGTYTNLKGSSITTTDLTGPEGRGAFANTNPGRVKKSSSPGKPGLVKTVGGDVEIKSAFTEWSGGMKPVMLLGMTPVTLPKIVAAASVRGYFAELRAGDVDTAENLGKEIQEVSRDQEEMSGHRSDFAVNIMMIHLQRMAMIDKVIEMYQKGHGCRFLTLVAGVPEFPEVDKILKAGLKISIKIGSYDQYLQAKALIEAHPELKGKIGLQVESKNGGGHFGPETIEEMWPRIAVEARRYFAYLGWAGNIVTADDAAQAFTEGVSTSSGIPLPADAVGIGSAGMTFEESPVNPEVRDALRSMEPEDIVDFYSEFGAPVHYYRNGYYEALRRLDEIAKAARLTNGEGKKINRPFTTAERNEVIAVLNQSGNPKAWFSTAVLETSLWDRVDGQSLWQTYGELVRRAQSKTFNARRAITTYDFQNLELRDFVFSVDDLLKAYLQSQGVDLSFTDGRRLFEAMPRQLWDTSRRDYISLEDVVKHYDRYQQLERLLSGDQQELRDQFIHDGEFNEAAFSATVDRYQKELGYLHKTVLGRIFPNGVTRATLNAMVSVQAALAQPLSGDLANAFKASLGGTLFKQVPKAVLIDNWLRTLSLSERKVILREALAGLPNSSYLGALDTRVRMLPVAEQTKIIERLMPKLNEAVSSGSLADALTLVPQVYYQYDTTYGEWYDMTRAQVLDRFKELHTNSDGTWIEPVFAQYDAALRSRFSSYSAKEMSRKPSLDDRDFIENRIWRFRDRIFPRQIHSLTSANIVRDFRTGFASFANVPGADPQWTALTPGLSITRVPGLMSTGDYMDAMYTGAREKMQASGMPVKPDLGTAAFTPVSQNPLVALDDIDGVTADKIENADQSFTYSIRTDDQLTLANAILKPIILSAGKGPIKAFLENAFLRQGDESVPNTRLPALLVSDPNTLWKVEVDTEGNITALRKYDLSLVSDPTDPNSLAKGLKIEITAKDNTVTVEVTSYKTGAPIQLKEEYRLEKVNDLESFVLVDADTIDDRHRTALASAFGVDKEEADLLNPDAMFTSQAEVTPDWIRQAVEASQDHNVFYVYGSRNGYLDHLEGKGRRSVAPIGTDFALGLPSAIQTLYPPALHVNPVNLFHLSRKTEYVDGKHPREGDILLFKRQVVGYTADPQNPSRRILTERAEIYRLSKGSEFVTYAIAQSPYGQLKEGTTIGDTLTFVNKEGVETTKSTVEYLDEIRTKTNAESIPGDGELVGIQTNSFVLRDPMREGEAQLADSRPEGLYKGAAVQAPTPKPALTVSWMAPDQDQLDEYAKTGDQNPIHTDVDVARFVGLPGTIVHGEFTGREVAKHVVTKLAGGDPTRVRAFQVTWTDPVPTASGKLTLKMQTVGLKGSASVNTGEVTDAHGRIVAQVYAEVWPETTAVLNPGQGILEPGAHTALIADERIRAIFDHIDAFCIANMGWSPRQILENPKLKVITLRYKDGTTHTYRHPEWIGKHTMFTQPLQAIIEKLKSLRDQARGLLSEGLQREKVAGSSVGEFTMDVISALTTFEVGVELTFQRGRYMADVVDPLRDPVTGVSPFSMYAVLGVPKSVVEEAMQRARLETVALAQARPELKGKHPEKGLPIGIANINTPEQFVITGYDAAVQLALKYINEYALRRAAMLGRTHEKVPYIKVDVDIPFHLWEILGDKVPDFRQFYYDHKDQFDIEVIRSYVGRHYPNLTGRAFSDSKDYIQSVYNQLKTQGLTDTDLHVLKDLLDNYDTMDADERLFKFFVEVRVFQFANTTQWATTIGNMHTDGVRRFVATANVVAGQVNSTLKRKVGADYQSPQNPDRDWVYDLTAEKDYKALTFEDAPEAVVEAAPVAAAVTAAVTAAPVMMAVPVAAAPTGPINDGPVPELKLGKVTDPFIPVLRMIVGSVAGEAGSFDFTKVNDESKIKAVRGGGSQEMLKLGKRLAQELKVPETDTRFADAQDRSFIDLAGYALAELGAYSGPGAYTKEIFGTIGFPVDFQLDDLMSYLSNEWRMPSSQVYGAIPYIVAAAKGWVPGVMKGSITNALEAIAFVDTAVKSFFALQQISMPSKKSEIAASKQAGGGGGIDLAEAMPQILDAVRLDQARTAFAAAFPGMDLDRVLAQSDAYEKGGYASYSAAVGVLAEKARQLDIIAGYIGAEAIKTMTTPAFKKEEARDYHTNFAAAQTVALIWAVKRGALTDLSEVSRRMMEIAERADDQTITIIDTALADPGNDFIKPFLTVFREKAAEFKERGRLYRPDHVITMPVTVWETDQYGPTGQPKMIDVPRVYPQGHPQAGEPLDTMDKFLDYLASRSQNQAPVTWGELPGNMQGYLIAQWEAAVERGENHDDLEKYQAKVIASLNADISEYAAHPDAYPASFIDAAKKVAHDGINRTGEVHLFTGATLGNINFSVVRNKLRAGAVAIIAVTDMQKHSKVWEKEWAPRLVGMENRVILVQMRAGNRQDANNLAKYIYEDLGYDLDAIHPFAAVMDLNTAVDRGADAQGNFGAQTQLVNTDAVLDLISAVNRQKETALSGKVTRVIVPCSDNDGGDYNTRDGRHEGGGIGGDGGYEPSKAMMKLLMSRAETEPWGNRFSVRGFRISYTRGTHVNRFQDPTAAGVEQEGVVTFATDDTAFFEDVIDSPEADALFQDGQGKYQPRLIGVPGGLTRVSLSDTIQVKRAELDEVAAAQKVAHDAAKVQSEASTKEARAQRAVDDILKISARANTGRHTFTRPAWATLTPDECAKLQARVRPEQRITTHPRNIVVLMTMDESASGGDLETRFALATRQLRDLSLDAYAQLGVQMGLVRGRGALWMDVKATEEAKAKDKGAAEVLVTSEEFVKKYGKYIDAHVLIRSPETSMTHQFDPEGTLMPFEIVFKDGGKFIVESSDIRYFCNPAKPTLPDGRPNLLPFYRGSDIGGGKFEIVRLPGAKGTVYRRVPIDTIHMGQHPTGYSSTHLGYKKDQFANTPGESYEWFLVASDFAAMRAGEADPGQWVHETDSDRWGWYCGSGIGPQDKVHEFFAAHMFTPHERSELTGLYEFAASTSGMEDVTIQNSLLAAATNQAMMHKWGITGPNIGINGACAGHGNSLAAAWMAITSGEVDYAVAGNVDNGANPWSAEGFRKASASRAGETAHGRLPEELANALSGEGAGFPISGGAVFQVLANLEVAMRSGKPFYSVLAYAGSAGNAHQAQPMPFPATLRALQRASEIRNRVFRMGPGGRRTINFHGTGTKQGDMGELLSYLAYLQWDGRIAGDPVLARAVKNLVGHLFQAAMGMDVNEVAMVGATGVLPGVNNLPNWHQGLVGNNFILASSDPYEFDPLNPEEWIHQQDVASYGFGQFNAAAKFLSPVEVMAALWDPVNNRPRISPQQYEVMWNAMNKTMDAADAQRDEVVHGTRELGATLRVPDADDMAFQITEAKKPGSRFLGPPPGAFSEDQATALPPLPLPASTAETINSQLNKSGIFTGRLAAPGVADAKQYELMEEIRATVSRGDSTNSKNRKLLIDPATQIAYFFTADSGMPEGSDPAQVTSYISRHAPLFTYQRQGDKEVVEFYFAGAPLLRLSLTEGNPTMQVEKIESSWTVPDRAPVAVAPRLNLHVWKASADSAQTSRTSEKEAPSLSADLRDALAQVVLNSEQIAQEFADAFANGAVAPELVSEIQAAIDGGSPQEARRLALQALGRTDEEGTAGEPAVAATQEGALVAGGVAAGAGLVTTTGVATVVGG